MSGYPVHVRQGSFYPHGMTLFIPREAEKVSPTRTRVVKQVEDWGIYLDENTADILSLVVSELVTNGVLYGKCAILTLGLYANRIHRRCLIEVHDDSRDMPRARTARPDEESGRGMFLVSQLSVQHGSAKSLGGKLVWAELELPEQPDEPHFLTAVTRTVVDRSGLGGVGRALREASDHGEPPELPAARTPHRLRPGAFYALGTLAGRAAHRGRIARPSTSIT